MPAIEVHVLRLADFIFPANHPSDPGGIGLVNGYLVLTPDGPIIVDTGMGPPHPLIDKLYQPTRYDIDAALATAGTGVSRDDITAVTNCHLHFDHSGGNQFFSGRPIYAQAAEHKAAQTPNYTIPEFVDFPGAKYELLDGRTEIVPGVTLLPTPGHSPGHQSVLLDCEDGLVILGGQVAESIAELTATPEDEQSAQSLRVLLDLDPLRIHLGHDATIWSRPPTSEAT